MMLNERVRCVVTRLSSEYLLLTLLVLSLGGNACLAFRLSLGATPQAITLTQGTTVPSFEAVDAKGVTRTLRFSRQLRPTVVFAYSPDCPWCTRTWPLFKQIADAASDRFTFVTLSVGAMPVYQDVNVSAFARPSRLGFDALHLGTVPQTLLIGVDGRIERAWLGAYAGQTKAELERRFGASFHR